VRHPQQGFTLIELAIVMVVLTILAAGLLVPLTTSIETRRYKMANEDMAKIQDALIGYAMTHTVAVTCTCNYTSGAFVSLGSSCSAPAVSASTVCPNTYSGSSPLKLTTTRHYLPCPNYDGTGIETARDGTTGACGAPPLSSTQTPLLPWATLGLPATDPWGDSYGYDVYGNYANRQIGFGSENAPPDDDPNGPYVTCPPQATDHHLRIYQSCESSGPLANTLVASQLAAVVISFGPNGSGAYNPTNHVPLSGNIYTANPSPISPDEFVNTQTGGNANHNYVSHPASDAGSSQGEFDDIVWGLPFAVLLNRVCPAGGCP
jgi:prepilin-type N-terminal cleavage/methylation domain-containing protein